MSENTENKYLVVEFPNERDETGAVSMAIISSTWIYEDDGCLFCYWPSYFRTDHLRDKAVQNHVDLHEDKCMRCPIIIKFTTDDYLKARSKLVRLEVESQTESEMEDRGKRKQKKKVFQNYESDSYSDDDIPQIPLPKKFSNKLEISKKQCLPQKTVQPHQSEKFAPIKKSKTFGLDLDEIPDSEREKFSTTSSCTGCDENKKLITEVLRQLKIVKEDTSHLIRLFMDREERQVSSGDFQKIYDFEDLAKLNEELTDKAKFAEMCSILQYIGGKDDSETCRKILTKLMSNDLAVKTNWTGRNDKNGFKDLRNLIQLIHVSVRKNPLSKDCTLNCVETIIKAWLRTAGDREGGRAKRSLQK